MNSVGQLTQPNKNIYGFQIQENTTWKPGLSEADLQKFQNVIGFAFPEPLRNFYKVVNGLSKPGINMYGSVGTKPTFSQVFYSYSQDIDKIKELIKTIRIRKSYQLKLPDALIAATVITHNMTLIADNDKDFGKVAALKYINPNKISS